MVSRTYETIQERKRENKGEKKDKPIKDDWIKVQVTNKGIDRVQMIVRVSVKN